MPPNNFDACKGPLRHAWEYYTELKMQPPPFGERMSLICTRCNTRRHDIVSLHSGELLARRYDYPEGYRLATGDIRPSTEELRITALVQYRAKKLFS